MKIPVMKDLLKGKLVKIDDRLFSFMTQTKQGRKRHVSGDHFKMEVSQYLLEPCEGTHPLQYRKENEDKFPILAKIYVNVPATSVPVERHFSIAGKILRPDKCRLNDSTFQTLTMLNAMKKLANNAINKIDTRKKTPVKNSLFFLKI